MTTEEPTMEFRQVRHKANLWNGDWYVFFVTQQKWIIHEEVDPSFSHGGKIGRDEWRDLEIVDARDAK